MELASIYLYETKFDQNKFTLDFLTNESDFNVFFNKKTTYYITNLDANLILDEENDDEIKKIASDQNIKKLSALSNELIKNSFNNNKKVNYVHLHWFDTNVYKYNLKLNDDLIDLMSYKYKFLDIKKNKIIDCKIYNPYSHLKYGIEFESEKGKSTYKIQLVGDKLIKTLNYDPTNFKLDFWYKFVNFMMISLANSVILVKFPRYELIEYLYLKVNKRLDLIDLFEIYYKYIDVENEIICHENQFSTLSEDQKKNIAFVVQKNRKIKVLAKKFVFIPPSNYRSFFTSFFKKFKHNGRYPIPKNYLDLIKKKEPFFPFSYVDSYYTGSVEHEIQLRANNI